jgi:hypothetical protein
MNMSFSNAYCVRMTGALQFPLTTYCAPGITEQHQVDAVGMLTVL